MNQNNILKSDPEKIRDLINLNFDVRQYFYSQADVNLLNWLWENKFFDVIQQKIDKDEPNLYRMPELDYLARIAEKDSSTVTDIMLSVDSTPESFNPEVISRFQWICNNLSAVDLARIIPKIKSEQWIKLMSKFRHSAFEYEKMLDILTDAKDYFTLLDLIEEVLTVRDKNEIGKTLNQADTNNPFYISDLTHTKVFQHLSQVDDKYIEAAFILSLKVFKEVIALGGKNTEDSTFAIQDTYSLYDVDFFDVTLSVGNGLSSRETIKQLAATITVLARKVIQGHCGEKEYVRSIYKKYIEPLPDARSVYRLRLFIFSLCTDEFKKEIKTVLFEIFDKDKFFDLIGGAEYERLIQSSFSVLTQSEQREFVSNTIEKFSKEEGLKLHGRDILSAALPWLTEGEKNTIKEKLSPLLQNYEPSPSIGPIISGTVRHQSPGDEEAWKRPVAELIKSFKNEWAPQSIKETYQETDFLHPVDAEGVGERIQEEVTKRTAEFITNAKLFFNRETLDAHYTYSYLQGIDKLLRDKKFPKNIDITPLFKLFNEVRLSDETKAFGEQGSRDRREWLANWDDVHSTMGDILKIVLSGESLIFNFSEWRDYLLNIIKYLLGHHRPTPQEEEPKTATRTITSPGLEPLVTDPYNNAINSVRGRAFEAFLQFVYHDGKILENESENIASDVKQLYENTLQSEDTPALFSMFGHYLYFFYLRDDTWIKQFIPIIFPDDSRKTNLYFAAWEGYLSSSLYQELFQDAEFQKLYERASLISSTQYPKRSYLVNLDEGLGTHLALGYVHYDDFSFDHPLFKLFWEKGSDEKHAGFVSFIGRSFLSGKNERADEQLQKHPQSKDKIIQFWEWALSQNFPVKVYAEFGYWMSTEKNIFDTKWLAKRIHETLKKTNGVVEWDYGLSSCISQLAKYAPEETVEILRLHFLEAGVRNPETRDFFYLQEEWINAFKIVFQNPSTQLAAKTLISNLLKEGGNVYWSLKQVIETEKD